MNAEKNTANCWKKAITIIHCILVVSVLKTTTSLQLQLPERAPAFFAPKASSLRSPMVHRISHQPGWLTSSNTGLKVITAHQSSPANRANPARNQALRGFIIHQLGCFCKPWEIFKVNRNITIFFLEIRNLRVHHFSVPVLNTLTLLTYLK